MATANFHINAEDGWVAVTDAAVSFIRIRTNTPNHAFFVTTGSSAPTITDIGFKQQCDEGFWCDVAVATGELYYVRVAENLPQDARIDVFYIAVV